MSDSTDRNALIVDLSRDLDSAEERVAELETALRLWLNVRMKDYTDNQYGKGVLREVLQRGHKC